MEKSGARAALKTKTGDELDDFLEARAAKVETSDDIDSTSIRWNSLKADFDDTFAVVMDVLKNPEFRADKIELAKYQINTNIARRNDDPMDIAISRDLAPWLRKQ